jgi:hypothetical protein
MHGEELPFEDFSQKYQNCIEVVMATRALSSIQPDLEETKEPELTRENVARMWRM